MSYLRAALLIFVIQSIFAGTGWLIAGPSGAIIATIIALSFHILVLWKADSVVLHLHDAREVDENDSNPMVRAYVQDARKLADEARLVRPRTYLVETHQPNAFVTGRDAQNASIAVTSGLLMTLNREEARSVVAHELAHVKRGDALAMGVAAAIAAILSRIAWIICGPFGAGRQAERFISRGIAIISASRQREYAADREAARITRKPMALATGLEKIERNAMSLINPLAEKNPATSHLYVIDPLHTHDRNSFSTHPSTQMRISRLRDLAIKMADEDKESSSA